MTNKLTKVGEQFMVGEDATMVVTDQENRITKTETDFILVEQTPEPNKVLGFDAGAQLKQFNLSAQGEELLRAILPGNSFVIVDNEGHISVVSMETGSGNLPITGGTLTGPLTIESSHDQLKLKRAKSTDQISIAGLDENGEYLWRLINENNNGAVALTLINLLTNAKILFDSTGETIIKSGSGNTLRLDTGDTTHVGGLTVEGEADINYLTRTGAYFCDVTGMRYSGTTKQVFGDRLTGDTFEAKYYIERLETGDVRVVIGVGKDGVFKAFRFTATGDVTADGTIFAGGFLSIAGGDVILQGDGNILGPAWGNTLKQYIDTNFVQGVQYSAKRRIGVSGNDEIVGASGEVMKGLDMWDGSSENLDGFYVVMTQVKINNTWLNIAG